jgi:polysaccharide transporter, PST family
VRKLTLPNLNAKILASLFDGETWVALASVSVWQLANYAIPLITFPYLARVLGVLGIGAIGLGTVVAGYALLVADWGFSLSATQAVARERDNPAAVNRIIWATISAKIFLGFISSAAVVCGALLLVSDPSLKAVLIISTLNVVASVFSVDWALRAVEQFSKFATASVVGRVAALPLVFLLVQKPSQVAEATFVTATGGLITAAITLFMAWRLGILRRPAISVTEAIVQIKDGLHIFLSTATISLYTNGLAAILGLTVGTTQVGLFSSAENIRRPVFNLLSPIGIVFYSRTSYMASTQNAKAQSTALHILRIQGAVSALLSFSLFITAPILIRLLFGEGFEASIPVLRILSSLVFIIAVSNILGLMIMLPMGLRREFTRCTIFGAVVGISLVIPFAYYDGAVGASIAAVLAEIAVTSAMYLTLKRRFQWFKPFQLKI